MSLVVLAALTGCDKMGGKSKDTGSGSGSATVVGSGSAPQASTEDILIGHYASLTGAESTFGISTDQGVILALEERNAAGGVKGRKLKLKTLDDASKSTDAANVVQRLISEDHVVALIGEVASGSSLAGGKIAQQYGVPMISPSSTNRKVTEGRDMVSRVCFLDEFQGYVVAKFAKDNKWTKAATLFDQASPYSKGLAESFTTEFTALGGTVATSQAYTAGDVSVSAQLQQIKTSGAEAVFLPGYYTDVGNIIVQARKIGLTVPFLGGDGWDSSKLAQIGGEAIEGSYYSNHYSFDEARPEVAEFVTKYKARWKGEVPDGLAALGYDAARVMFDAMARAPSLGGKELAAAIAATKDFAGVTGKITLDANRDAQKKAVVVQMKGGQPHFVASIGPKGSVDEAPAAGSGSGSATGSAAGSGSATGSATK
ncbi:MAG: ABC transporter substrate-binding protein [Proteobacteria bacterium]|nr:ABC transporter substrate-binding protein [Pseudomonadota bacterium]